MEVASLRVDVHRPEKGFLQVHGSLKLRLILNGDVKSSGKSNKVQQHLADSNEIQLVQGEYI